MERPTEEQIAAWHSRLFRTALRMTGNHEDAADLTQDAFFKALKQWGEFNGKALPTTWLHSILINCVMDWRRRRALRNCEPLSQWRLPVTDEQVRPENTIEHDEKLSHLRTAINDLPEMIRFAFVATVLDGYTYEEAAELLGIPVGTVASRVHEARKRTCEAMQRRFGED